MGILNRHPKIKSYHVFIICFLFIGCGFLYLSSTIQNSNDKALVISELNQFDNLSTTEGLAVNMTTTPSWKGEGKLIGAQYDGIILNRLDQEITDWRIEITTPEGSKFDGGWNGVYSHADGHLVIKAVDYNTLIKPNSEDASFGFILYTPGPIKVEKIRVEGYRVYELNDFSLFWILVGASFLMAFLWIAYFISDYRVRLFRVKHAEDKKMIIQSLNTFANFIDAKDSYTKGHSTRVACYSKEIARRLGLKPEEQENLYYIALLHDVGKVGVRNEILDKPGKLTEAELEAIQMHTLIGADILKDFTALKGIAEGARYHHEFYDGNGYPSKLKGLEIPLYARIICVADAYDAMSSDRYYRNRLSEALILSELRTCSGTQFDPEIVHHMMKMIEEGYIKDIYEENAN